MPACYCKAINERAIREGELILHDRLQQQPDDLNALELLAFSA